MIQVDERVRIPAAFEVRADKLYGWAGKVEVAYFTTSLDLESSWSRLVEVRRSEYQGIELVLVDGTVLQACFPERATYVVRHVRWGR